MDGRFDTRFQVLARREPAAVRTTASGIVAAVVAFGFVSVLAAQSPAPKPAGAAGPKPAGTAASKPAARPASSAAAAPVDTIIELVKGGMSEADVLSSLKDEGKTYKLTLAETLKLRQGGVSQKIIDALKGPGGAAETTRASAPTASAPAASGAATPFPPDLPDVPQVRKRMLAVKPFDYSTVTTWVNYWFNNTTNIGEGIRSMLGVRLHGSPTITLLERANIKDVMGEQDFTQSNRVKKGTGAKIGGITGADVMLYGDIVIFGRDDKKKNANATALLNRFAPPVVAGVAMMNKEEKAVVGINLRLVDTETAQVIETAEARGESSRKSKDYAGILGVKGAAAGGGAGMSSSNFEQTIIGEATSNAVTKIVEYLEGKLPQMPPKAREIEGRVAVVAPGSATLAIGGETGVQRGDRFEILKINGNTLDPVTKEVIDVDAVKVGELVVDTVRDKTASGQYGGQALSAAYVTGKGYAARLMTK